MVLARVALIEDDEELREKLLGPGLECYGFATSTFPDATEFYEQWTADAFDLLVVDVNLPSGSGLRVIQHLRASGSQIGMVALSALPIESAGLSAFQLGGDLYLMKPVTVGLLASALHAVLRRTWSATSAGGGTVVSDASDREGWYLHGPDGELIALTEAERTIIQRLRREQGRPVEREALIESLTGNTADFDPHRLDVLIHRLRRKVVRTTEPKLEIVTIRGSGYGLLES
ncbi:response regulator transcription factor [Luteibacter sp. ME-Dv--P-043b]|uniref:response regulator transcription factor n=1 Tax=unclassified Luteibacter TaxID=2620188 RepID=UPI00055C71B2|nr:response regulator transcription factor [Luteibacter sp. ME-Dv--P-043b]